MVNWQVTASTIYCDTVDDDVTLLIYKDRSAKCTGYRKYGEPDRDTAGQMKGKARRLGRQLGCEGAECRWVVQYRDRLFAEEECAG